MGDKIVTLAPAAPDAQDDLFDEDIFEDGASGLGSPSKTPTPVVLDVLKNDSDADFDQLTITAFHDGPAHGTVEVSADGKSVLYTPFLDYSGPDSFEYCVSDGNGGQDHAKVDLVIQAVADTPTINVEVLSGADVYHFILKVTASQNDFDSSEFIDRIEASVAGGLPVGMTRSCRSAGSIPATSQTRSSRSSPLPFLPARTTSLITLKAFSQETSNGDQEVASLVKTIELDFNHNLFNRSFSTTGQDIWGPGPAFSFHEQEFIGLDETFDPPQIDIPIPPTPILFFGDAFVDAKVGFDFEVSITGGELDATVPFDVNLDTAYNKTTDQLLVDPSFVISAAGATITAQGPGGFLSIQPIFDVLFDLQVGLDLIVDEINLAGVNQRVNPPLPGLTLEHRRCQNHDPACPGNSRSASTFPRLTRSPGLRRQTRSSPTTAATTSSRLISTSTRLRQTSSRQSVHSRFRSRSLPGFLLLPKFPGALFPLMQT